MGNRIKARQEDGHKSGEMDIVDVEAVDALQNLGRGIGFRGHGADRGLQAAHQHPGRDTMPGNIRDNQSMRAIAEVEEIEVVPTDNSSRTGKGSQFYAWDIRGNLG